MFNQLKSSFLVATMLAVFGFFTIAARPVDPLTNQSKQDGGLTINQTSSTSVDLSWSDDGENPNYYIISVFNVATDQLVQEFTVTSTFVTVDNLTTGNTYLFSVISDKRKAKGDIAKNAIANIR